MTDAKPCPRCGAPIPADAAEGLCAACLMLAASEPPAKPSGGRFTPPAPDELAPLFPELDILEPIGAGAMGAVYRARQRRLERIVALKILPADADLAERFEREAKALARLNHPHLVAVYDVGRTGAWCWILMEHVDGANLRQVLATGRMQPADALTLCAAVCDALQYAHDQGVVHRDIKPENILLDKQGRPKLADFGLAKLAGSPVIATGTGQMLGTPHYMAPEQVEGGRDVDARADLYALGVVLYELLTGGLPLGRFSLPSQQPGVDERLDRIVHKALEKDPAKRYQSAREMQRDIEQLATPAQRADSVKDEVGSSACDYEVRDGVVLMMYAVVLFVVAFGLGYHRSDRPFALLGLLAAPFIAWGGRAGARGGDPRWMFAARILAICTLPVFFAWQPLAGLAAIFMVVVLWSYRLKSWERKMRSRTPTAPSVATRPVGTAAIVPPSPQPSISESRHARPRIGFFGFLSAIVQAIACIVIVALIVALILGAIAMTHPDLAAKIESALHNSVPRLVATREVEGGVTIVHERPGDARAGVDAAESIVAEIDGLGFLSPDHGVLWVRWQSIQNAVSMLVRVRAGETATGVLYTGRDLGALARRAAAHAAALASAQIRLRQSEAVDKRLTDAFGRLGDALDVIAAHPEEVAALDEERFAVFLDGVDLHPSCDALAVSIAPGVHFTASQANRILWRLRDAALLVQAEPQAELDRAAVLLRPYVTDVEAFVVPQAATDPKLP